MIVISGDATISALAGVVFLASADHEGAVAECWTSAPTSIDSGVTDAHGRVYNTDAARPYFDFANTTNLSCGARFRPRTGATNKILLAWYDSADGAQSFVRLTSGGEIEIVRSTTTLEVSSGLSWTVDTWYYVTAKVVIDDSGSWVVKIWSDTGTLLKTLSGSGDTKFTANTGVQRVRFGDTSDSGVYFEDAWIDRAGVLVGRYRVEDLYPTGAGNSASWTRAGTDTGANYSQVNETVKDTVSEVRSTAADQYDLYACGNRVISGTPIAVQISLIGERLTGGPSPVEFKNCVRIGSTTYDGTITQGYTSTSDIRKIEVWNNDPSTNSAWNDTNINAMEIGMKSVTENVRAWQVTAQVLVEI